MKNIKKSIYGVTDALVLPILMLVAMPVFLSYLGVTGFATWVLINSVVATLSVFNFGGTEVITKFISSYRGGNVKHTTNDVFSTVFFFQAMVLLVIYGLFLITAPFINQLIASDNLLRFVDILYFVVPMFFFKQSEQLLYAFLRGFEQFGRVMVVSTISKVLFLSVQIVVAIQTESIKDVFFGALIISALLFLLQVVYIKALHGNGISFSGANVKTAKSLLNFGGWNWLSSLVTMLKGESDKWLVSGLLGLKTFGIYSIGILVFNQLYAIVVWSVYWVFPSISKGGDDKAILASRYWKLLFSVSILSIFISVTLENLGALFELWLGVEFYQSSQYYISTFLILFPVFTMTIASYLYLLGLGLVKQKFFTDAIVLIVKIVTIWLVIDVFKIEEWALFFMVFISVEYIIYSIIISRNLPINFVYLITFFLLQVIIVLIRI